MDCLAFHTVKAVTEATDSFRHFSLALCKISSERFLSESLVFVMVRAVALILLLICSVTTIQDLSSSCSQTGMVTGQADKILPINKPFAKVASKLGGIEKLNL